MDQFNRFVLRQEFSIPTRYAIAAAIMFVCSVLQIGLKAQADFAGVFLLLPGIVLSGLVCDRGSGLFAAVIASTVAAFLIYSDHHGFRSLMPWVLFAITAVGVAAVSNWLRVEMKRALTAEETKTVLLLEMAHRTKNNLSILSSMVRLQARNGDSSVAAALEGTARRIQVMAEVYDQLSIDDDVRQVDMRNFLSEIVEKVFHTLAATGPVTFKVICDKIYLPSQQALALGIIANELVTNSLKYAFPGERSGTIVVQFSAVNGIELTVSDNGVGLLGNQRPRGLGSRIILLLVQQLNGVLSHERLEPGTRIRVRAPVQTEAPNLAPD